MRIVRMLPAVVVALAGCGKEEGGAAHPVSGEVVYDGKPAAGVKVFFLPNSGVVPGAAMNPRGVTGPDGRFTLSTFGENDGAPAGGYRVVLVWPAEGMEAAEGNEAAADRLFGWYDARHTVLKAQVVAGANDLKPYKLPAVNGPPPKSEGIPGRN